MQENISEKPVETPPPERHGSKGGLARARNLTAEQRREIAKKAADARWRRFRATRDLWRTPPAVPAEAKDHNPGIPE